MAELAIAASIISAVGTIAGGMQANAQGKAQKQAYEYAAATTRQQADYIAKQEEQRAGQERAASQRAAMEEKRKGRLVGSRAQAVAAASGGGALDPTIVDIGADIAGEGEYRAMTSLYQGEEAARGLEGSAAVRRYAGNNEAELLQYQGRAAAAAGRSKMMGSFLSAAGSIGSAGSSLYSKYGGGGPSGGTSFINPDEAISFPSSVRTMPTIGYR